MFLASQSTRLGGKYSIQTNKEKKNYYSLSSGMCKSITLSASMWEKKSSEKSEHKTKCLLQSYLKMIIEILKP